MPTPKSCRCFPPPFLFFPAYIYRQPGERFAIPCSSAGHGSPSHFSSIMLAGYGCVGMGHAGFWASGVERETRRISGNKDLKSSSSLPLHAQGRRRIVLKRHCFGLFFFF
jgi:hypothetical protein